MKTRLAPTPSGFLHAGNGASFILTWKLAREANGQVLLRIDDLDAERVRSEYLADIFETLAWLGLDWDEGPRTVAELNEHWSQHRRMDGYMVLMERLRAEGHLYACTCSRKDVAARTTHGEYDGHCRDKGLAFALPGCRWRLRLPEGGVVTMRTWPDGQLREVPLDMADPVVRQQNGRPAYQIASLADDLQFGVDLIVRGMDLLPSTAIQLYLAKILGREDFTGALFLHHPLLLDEAGHKRSKSQGADSLREWRREGGDARMIYRLAKELLQEARQT